MSGSIAGVSVARTPTQVREWVVKNRAHGKRVAFVPTMGALHEGHLKLCDLARQHADVVIVSIFVNPLQFGPKEDFSAYPRDLAKDCAACASRGVELVYAPDVKTMYPEGFCSRVQISGLGDGLCGASRPGHFDGVATVVLKLLNIANADVAIFGEKDWQQLQIVRALARDFDVATEIIGAPIVRENSGLAMSSRNAYLSADERDRAATIAVALCKAAGLVIAGQADAAAVKADIRSRLEAAGGRVDYVEIVEPASLVSVERLDKPSRAVVAVFFGRARLLDNCPLPAAGR